MRRTRDTIWARVYKLFSLNLFDLFLQLVVVVDILDHLILMLI